MRTMFFSVLCLFLMAADCDFITSNRHWEITIKNKSEYDVWLAFPLRDGEGKCFFSSYKPILKGETYAHRPFFFSIEKNIGDSYELYLVSDDKFSEFDCDSIAVQNKVLKQYVLTLEDLEAMDFTITYP